MIAFDASMAVTAAVKAEAHLRETRQQAVGQVNETIGEIRSLYITVIPGQDATYLTKAEQARAYLADTDPQPEDYPLIYGEVGITGETAHQVAMVVVNLAAQWGMLAALLERMRLAAIMEIGAEANVAGIEARLAAFGVAAAAFGG